MYMTTKELYIKHKSGEISNQKFLYEVRRDSNLPWITNMTSYEDAVKILKNKGIINEADAKKYDDVEVISKTIDMVNPYEYSKGMNYELDMANNPIRQDLTQDKVLAAQKIVLKNLTKDSNYYTKLYAGLKPTTDTKGYKEIEIAGKNLEKGIKADMAGRKADGYIKKELKKDAKANVKDNLGDSEKAPKKPKGVKVMPDKGVEGKEKVVKESLEELKKQEMISSPDEFPNKENIEEEFRPGVDLGSSFEKMKGEMKAEDEFNSLMSKYDWYYEMSDDPRVYDHGKAMDYKLKALSKQIGVDKAIKLFNAKAPSDRKVTSSFFMESKDKHTKIKEALKKALKEADPALNKLEKDEENTEKVLANILKKKADILNKPGTQQ